MMRILKEFLRSNGTTLRIASGQVSVLITLLLMAAFFGLIPDRNTAVMEGRAALAESIAANSSVFITRSDLRRMEANLRLVMSRNPDILSAAVRQGEDRLLVTVGEHQGHWQTGSDSSAQLVVPIWESEKRWGQMELRFAPLMPGGLPGFLMHPVSLLIGFLSVTCTLFFFLYLRKMLKHLDPSQAIPDRVRSALDTMAEGLLVLDARQNIVLANEAFSTIVDVPSGDLLGQKVDIFEWSGMDDKPMERADYPWTTALKACIAQRNVSIRLAVGGSDRRTFQTSCSPVLSSDDKAGGVLISFDDITELEEKEKQLRHSKLEAERANQAKSDFLANMSHEIRTPMNAIMGFTEVLKRAYQNRSSDAVHGENLHYLNTIAKSSKHLLDLINDILDLSKVEAGRIEVETAPCAVHHIVQDVINVMRVRAEEKSLELDYVAEGELPATIQSDPARLRQILTNLVGNAVKFTERGSITIRTRMSREAGKPMLSIAVVDTGIGMSETQAADVFDPFVQADSSITRRFGGTGLGLSICKRFAEALGGDIRVDSSPGQGSTFTTMVPVGDLAGVAMLSPGELSAALEEHEQAVERVGRWLFKPARVLVVDDGVENRELLSVVLEDAGLQVSTAGDGQEALDKLSLEDIALVLMDVQMPVMDGYTAVKRMREQGLTLPVIALTGHAMKGAEETCRQAGYSGYMSKPIDIDVLVERLAEDLDGDFQHQAVPAAGGTGPALQQGPDPSFLTPKTANIAGS